MASYLLDWRLREAGALTGAFGLIAGVLLGAFGLLASWRMRFAGRGPAYKALDGAARRALDEAVALVLVSVLLSTLAAALTVVLANIMIVTPNGDTRVVFPVVATLVTAVLTWAASLLLLLFWVIVNLLSRSYRSAIKVDEEEAGRGAHRAA